MATSETTNLQLVKYGAGTDNFTRTDYNGNLEKIDTFAGNTNLAIGTLSSLKTPTKTNLVVAVNESYRVKETELASGTSWTLKIPTTPTGVHAHILTITSANGTIWGLYYINIPSGIDSVGTLTTIASGLGAPTVSAGESRTITISVASARVLYLSDLAMRGDFLTVQ